MSDVLLSSQISRRTALRLMASQMAATSIGNALPVSLSKNTTPNVVFVLMDDVGYGDLACNGNPVIKTPNIDSLYKRSVRFTDFHASPTCSPSRASLMTGRYSDKTGVWHTIMGRSLLAPGEMTMADCFKGSGYATGLFGKWHLGDNYPCRPQDRGFGEVVVCGGGGIWQTPDYFGNDDVDDTYLHNGKFEKYSGFSTDIFFDCAMGFMSNAQKTGQPFFCYLATTAAHMPMWAKDKDSAPYEGVPGLHRAGFYGFIVNIDENMGRLIRFLQARNLTDNTILIFSSDNGTNSGERVYNASMQGWKASPYDGGHRVPFFLSWPAGKLTGGRDIGTLTSHIDLLPTLVDLCRLKKAGKDMDGRSWSPLLYVRNPKWKDRTIVVDSQRQELLVRWKDTAVMTQRWRLVNSSPNADPSQLELYDIAKDPGQQNDIADQYPEVVRSLAAQYDAWWEKASADAGEYVRIVLGSDKENPSRLTCMDWHGDGANQVWNQQQIRTGPIANGVWTVDVSHAGKYRFELRRWPREVGLAISAPYVDTKPNREKTPGVAISATKARLMIGNIDQSRTIQPGDKYADFTVSLPRGPADLRTAFYDAELNERGAYYMYVEAL